MYRYTMYRDRIELNQQLNALISNELNKDDAATHPGRKVLLAAREITIPQGVIFELSNCDLVLPDKNSLETLGVKEPVEDEEILLSALPTVPKDDTLLREANSDKVYIIKNGVKMEIRDSKILDKFGVKLDNAKVVPEKALSLLPYGGVAN